MPSVSKKQHNLMAAVANNPAFAKKAGIPQRVGADFMKADKGRKFAKGGDMAKKMPPFMGKETKAEEAKEMMVKAKSPAMYRKGEKAEGVHGKSGMEKPTKYAKGGGCELKGKTKAFAGGGSSMDDMAPRPRVGMAGPMPTGISRIDKNPPRPVGMDKKPQFGMGQLGNKFGPQGPEAGPTNYSKTPQKQSMPIKIQGKAGPVSDMMYRGDTIDPKMARNFSDQRTSEKMRVADIIKNKVGMAQRPQANIARTLTPQRPTGISNKPPENPMRGMPVGPAQSSKPGVAKPLTMPMQRKGGFSMSPEAKAKIGDGLSKMMGDVRAKGAQAMPPRSGAGFKAPNMMDDNFFGAKKGGSVKKFAKGGGCELKGKTKGRII